MLNSLITSKTRVKLLVKFFISSANSGHLRRLATEFNVLNAINSAKFPTTSTFGLVTLAGFGLNFGKSKATDVMGDFQIVIKPQYNVSSRIGIFLDGSYIMNFKQNYGFNGMCIPGESETIGSYITGLIGIAIKLGR